MRRSFIARAAAALLLSSGFANAVYSIASDGTSTCALPPDTMLFPRLN